VLLTPGVGRRPEATVGHLGVDDMPHVVPVAGTECTGRLHVGLCEHLHFEGANLFDVVDMHVVGLLVEVRPHAVHQAFDDDVLLFLDHGNGLGPALVAFRGSLVEDIGDLLLLHLVVDKGVRLVDGVDGVLAIVLLSEIAIDILDHAQGLPHKDIWEVARMPISHA
jgi:hypothetical protein